MSVEPAPGEGPYRTPAEPPRTRRAAPRWWVLLAWFQLPTAIVAIEMRIAELSDQPSGYEFFWVELFAVPCAIAGLISATVTWALERRPAASGALWRTLLRYELTPAILAQVPIVLFAGFAATFSLAGERHDWHEGAITYAAAMWRYLLWVAIPLLLPTALSYRRRRRA